MEALEASNGPPSNPRRYTIRSDFGRAREHRSRKNRPCNQCRRRKTACIITTEPPCDFCKSRGLACHSLPGNNVNSVAAQPEQPVPRLRSAPPAAAIQDNHAIVVQDGLVQQSGPASCEITSTGVQATLSNVMINGRIQTLEDNPNGTTHSMGLAAEQDQYFMDAFRPILLSERSGPDAGFLQVYKGGLDSDDHPVHFLLCQDEFPEHRCNATRAASDAIESIVSPHGMALVRLYFRHVHPNIPVISKGRFLRQYANRKDTIPASLRGAVYALACVFWRQDSTLVVPCQFSQHELVNHAQDSLRRELEAPNLSKLQASILLMHMTPPEMDSVETPYTWIMAAQATACAQMIGLHQDPGKWNLAPWEKKLRRKLWWSSYLSDCWASVCHGNPPHINSDSFNTLPPDLEDLRSDEDLPQDLHYMVDPADATFCIADGARYLEMINISRHLRSILDCSCSLQATLASRNGLVLIREKLKEWLSLLPNCLAIGLHPHNAPLHLSFYATQVLLFRGLMYPATRTAKATPESNLRQWLSLALSEFGQINTYLGHITETALTGFWGRYARSQFILCGNFLICLFLLATEPADVEAAYRHLDRFRLSIQRLGSTEDEAARLMLRPTMLRVESFFTQASELIKGQQGHIIDP